MTLALDGTGILTEEETVPATYRSIFLGDLGAEVIILERLGIGNPARSMPNFLLITHYLGQYIATIKNPNRE